jgi:hypothetical protein
MRLLRNSSWSASTLFESCSVRPCGVLGVGELTGVFFDIVYSFRLRLFGCSAVPLKRTYVSAQSLAIVGLEGLLLRPICIDELTRLVLKSNTRSGHDSVLAD